MSTSVIQETIRQWQDEPEKAIMKPTVKGRSDGVQAVIEAGPFSWRMDVPPPFGGTNKAPSPAALLLGSLAGCAALFIKATLAPQYGVAVEAVEATVSCTADGRGALGLAEAIPDLQDMAITIRTMLAKDGKITLAAGAGIVADSVPEYEFEETINKARAVLTAIDLAREGMD